MRRAGIIFIVILVILNLSGCFNYRELKDFTIVMGLGIDMGETLKYQVTAEIALPDEKQSHSVSEPIKPKVLTAEGNTLAEGVKSLMSDNNLYFNHCRIAVLSQAVAEDGIKDIADFFLRSSDFQKNMIVAVTPKKAVNLFEIPAETLPVLSEELARSIVSAENMRSKTVTSNVYEIFNKLSSSLTLPEIVTVKKDNKVFADIDGIAFFKDGRYRGRLSSADSLYYLLLVGKAKKGMISLGDYDAVEIIKSNVKTDNNHLNISVELSVLGSGSLNLSNDRKKEISQKSNQLLELNIMMVAKKVNSEFGYENEITEIECHSTIRDGRLSR